MPIIVSESFLYLRVLFHQQILCCGLLFNNRSLLQKLYKNFVGQHFLNLGYFTAFVFVYKYVNGIIDFKFDTKLISDIHSYNTRGKSNFYLPRVRRNYGKQRLLYQGLGEWNSLDKSIRDMRSLLIFKQFFNSFYNVILWNILILYF